MKLGVREVREIWSQPQRVLDPRIPVWKLVPIPSLKACLILLCPGQHPDQATVPNNTKPFSLLFEILLLDCRGTARVGCSSGTSTEAPGTQDMGINNIFLARVREHRGAVMLSENLASHPCSGFRIRLAGGRLGHQGQKVLLVPGEVVTWSVFTAWWTQGASGETRDQIWVQKARRKTSLAPRDSYAEQARAIWALVHLISLTPPKQVPLSPS